MATSETGFRPGRCRRSSGPSRPRPTHQGYIEPHACARQRHRRRAGRPLGLHPGPFHDPQRLRASCWAWTSRRLRVTASEIGGGFGGKTMVFTRAGGARARAKSGKPGQDGDDARGGVPRLGPDLPAGMTVKIGVTQAPARSPRAVADIRMQGRRLPPARRSGSALHVGLRLLRPGARQGRSATTSSATAEGRRPIARPARRWSRFARRERRSTMLAQKIGMDPIELRLKNAAKEGTQDLLRPDVQPHRPDRCLEAARKHRALQGAAGPEPGPRHRGGLLVQLRRPDLRRQLQHRRRRHGALAVGNAGHRRLARLDGPDGGRGAGRRLRARCGRSWPTPVSLGYNDITEGSRVTFVDRARRRSRPLATPSASCAAAPPRCGASAPRRWSGRTAVPSRPAVERRQVRTAVAGRASPQGGQDRRPDRRPRRAQRRRRRRPASASISVDVEVDPETGRVTDPPLHRGPGRRHRRSTRAMSKARSRAAPSRASAGRSTRNTSTAKTAGCENAGFLDYRIPVASDLPMIDTVIVEVPNPRHPFGVRGVGEATSCRRWRRSPMRCRTQQACA